LKLTHTDERRFLEEIKKFEISVNLDEIVNRIELPILRMIDLARALAHNPRLLILDEITAALPIDMAEKVVKTMGEEKAKGNSVIFISHRLAEIEQICDYATVLRDGFDVDSFTASAGSEDRIVAAMLGDKALTQSSKSISPRISQESVFLAKSIKFGRHLKDVSLSINRGEVVGLVALEGQGQDALFEILAGEIQPDAGEIRVRGEAVRFKHPSDAISRGISYVPGDRKTALLPQRSIRENLALTKFRTLKSWRPINQDREDSMVNKAVSDLEIDTRARSQVMRLSGGNQQKVTIGRWITTGFDVLLCFDPTRGIDVGTKGQIYKLLRSLADEGKSVLLFTSELREIQATCDRAVVLYEGEIHQELPYEKCDEETLLNSAHGRSV
jgi:ribose transport system ATP-binding protein